MNISAATQNQLASVQQAMQMVTLQNAMNQDGEVVDKLIQGMQENSKAVQHAAQPHRGSNIDVTV
ncbi:MAG: putative motility protein [Halanaerobiales bacterium]